MIGNKVFNICTLVLVTCACLLITALVIFGCAAPAMTRVDRVTDQTEMGEYVCREHSGLAFHTIMIDSLNSTSWPLYICADGSMFDGT